MSKYLFILVVLFNFNIKESHAESLREDFPMTVTSRELIELSSLLKQLSDFSSMKKDAHLLLSGSSEVDTITLYRIEALLDLINNRDNGWNLENIVSKYSAANTTIKTHYSLEEYTLFEAMSEKVHIIQNILHARENTESAKRDLSVNNVYHICDEGLRMKGSTRKKACGYKRPPKFINVYTCKDNGGTLKVNQVYGYSKAEACGQN